MALRVCGLISHFSWARSHEVSAFIKKFLRGMLLSIRNTTLALSVLMRKYGNPSLCSVEASSTSSVSIQQAVEGVFDSSESRFPRHARFCVLYCNSFQKYSAAKSVSLSLK